MLCEWMKRKEKEIIIRMNPPIIGTISEYNSINNQGLMYIECYIKDHKFVSIVDSGVSRNLIALRVA